MKQNDSLEYLLAVWFWGVYWLISVLYCIVLCFEWHCQGKGECRNDKPYLQHSTLNTNLQIPQGEDNCANVQVLCCDIQYITPPSSPKKTEICAKIRKSIAKFAKTKSY